VDNKQKDAQRGLGFEEKLSQSGGILVLKLSDLIEKANKMKHEQTAI